MGVLSGRIVDGLDALEGATLLLVLLLVLEDEMVDVEEEGVFPSSPITLDPETMLPPFSFFAVVAEAAAAIVLAFAAAASMASYSAATAASIACLARRSEGERVLSSITATLRIVTGERGDKGEEGDAGGGDLL